MHVRPQQRVSLESHPRPLLLAPLKPNCHGLWVRPGRALKTKKARLDHIRAGGGGGVVRTMPRGAVGLAALTPCPLCLCRSPVHPAPALPSCLSSVPCPLSPEQAGPGTLGPILAASSARLPLEVVALPGIAWPPPTPKPMLDPPSHCSGVVDGAGPLLPPGLWSLSTCSGGAPDPQHTLPRAHGPLLARRGLQHPRFPPSQ